MYLQTGATLAPSEEKLTKAGWRMQIQRKGSAAHGISARRSGVTFAFPHRMPVSNTCLASSLEWAENSCATSNRTHDLELQVAIYN
jgi:hypothetical protein